MSKIVLAAALGLILTGPAPVLSVEVDHQIST
jgi:hypothetical protein